MKEFPCTKCGACCKLIPANALHYYNLPEAEGGGCGHLKEDNTCAIYENRPEICDVQRTWKSKRSQYFTWDEYIKISVNHCKDLENRVQKEKEFREKENRKKAER